MLKHLLTILLFLPMLGAIAVALIRNSTAVRWTAFGTAMAALLASLGLLIPFHWRGTAADAANGESTQNVYGYADNASSSARVGGVQLIERAEVIPAWRVQYLMGIDGLSLPLVLAATIMFVIVVIASWDGGAVAADNLSRLKFFFALLLCLEAAVLGVFLSLDFVFLWIFLTISSLLLSILACRTCDGQSGVMISRLVYYMLASSILVLIVLLAMRGLSFDLIALASPRWQNRLASALAAGRARLLLVLLLAGLLIRMGAFPLHQWQARFHAEAAPAISMLTFVALGTTGGYCLLRIAYPLFPQATIHWRLAIAALGAVGMLYGGLCALPQRDFNRLLAYSSVAMVGLFLLGAGTLTQAGLRGAVFTLVAATFALATMFFLSGVLFDRLRHRHLLRFGGLAAVMPTYFQFACIGFLASAGVPAFGTFVGELLVVVGIFQAPAQAQAAAPGDAALKKWIVFLAVVCCIGIVLLAVALLRAMQRLFFGSPREQYAKGLADLDARQKLVVVILISVSFLLGVLPGVLVFGYSNATISGIVKLFR